MSSLEYFMVDAPFGFMIFNADGKVLIFEPFTGDAEVIADKLFRLDNGEMVDELKSFCNKVSSLFKTGKIFLDNERLFMMVKRLLQGFELHVDPLNPLFKKFRSVLPNIAISQNMFPTVKDYYTFLHSVSLLLSRRKLRKAVEKRDLLLAQSINAIDDLNKILNMMVSRLREWYGVHFPELNSIIDDHRLYTKIVGTIGSRDRYDAGNLSALGISESSFSKILSAAKSSIGADFDEYDINAIMNFARSVMQLYDVKDELESYIDSVADDVCPNLKSLVGPLISARLISLAGGLDKLARLPSSTIQVLGAEKALFRALRTGTKPPKHGVIFQCQEVHGAPKWQRGKIARALAGRLAIAARIDAFSGIYVGDRLKEDLYKRIEEIKKLYPKPVKKRVEVKERGKHRRRR
ncbi:MAG: C/D box methylation guide ribonucleoprotein complex aNOP56 subunit [archaeon GBS-70-058]|nr:C/D box methylation guide ribonucleoprotein complex aNOP56 subunit [Candidatus Culexarchaeum nevadense]